MGCGGSRTDALEPRYLESWTKDTESTWLTSTDPDIALSSIQNIPSENSSESGFTSEKNISSDFFDDGLPAPAQAYLKVCSAISEIGLNERKACNSSGELASHSQEALSLPDTTLQKRSVLCTEEITQWQDNRMSTKQVTITVTQSIVQVDQKAKAKVREASQASFAATKPAEGTKEAVGDEGLK